MLKVSNYILKKKIKNSLDNMNPFSDKKKKKDKKKNKDKDKKKEKDKKDKNNKKEQDKIQKQDKIPLSQKLNQKGKNKNSKMEDQKIQEDDGKTKAWNVVACCCTCEAWCTSCCSWYCIFTVFDVAVRQCNKSHGLRLFLLLLCFCFTPFLCCTGLINCLMGCSTALQKVQEFCKRENVLQGYKEIIVPEQSGPFIQKSEDFINECFTC